MQFRATDRDFSDPGMSGLDKKEKKTDEDSVKLTAAFKQIDGWWAASIEEIPGVHTQGETLEEARENLRDALEMVLEANRELAEQENEATTREEMLVA